MTPNHQIEFFSTLLGVLALAKQRGLLEEAKPLLTEIKASHYWLADELLGAFLTEAGESEQPSS